MYIVHVPGKWYFRRIILPNFRQLYMYLTSVITWYARFERASNILRAVPLDLLSHGTCGALSSNNTRHNNTHTTGTIPDHFSIIHPIQLFAVDHLSGLYKAICQPLGPTLHRDKLTLLEDGRRS